MSTEEEPVTYATYLKLDPGILSSQKPKTKVHEELLFIVTHQAFELWFKVVLSDLDYVAITLIQDTPADIQNKMLQVNSCMQRMCMIFKVVVQQFGIMETMSPLTFLEFRGHLGTGSGFQSVQFRLIENMLGLTKENRLKKGSSDYKADFNENEQQELIKSEEKQAKEKSLLIAVNVWLEKTFEESPKGESFWRAFEVGCKRWIQEMYPENTEEGSKDKESYQKMEAMFLTVQSEEEYAKAVSVDPKFGERHRKLTHKAFKGALMIYHYKDLPMFHGAYQFLKLVMDLEAAVAQWRSIHVLMVHRMIGNKPGTGGSTGVDYLSETNKCFHYRVFIDLFDLSTFIIPKKFMKDFKDL